VDESKTPFLTELKEVDRQEVESSNNEADRFNLIAVRKCLHSAVAGIALKTPGVAARCGFLHAVRLQGLHLYADFYTLVGDYPVALARPVVVIGLSRFVQLEERLNKLSFGHVAEKNTAKAWRSFQGFFQFTYGKSEALQESGHAQCIGEPAGRASVKPKH
jgi:hypothetical protein